VRRLELDFWRVGRRERTSNFLGFVLVVIGAVAAGTCGWRIEAQEERLADLRAQLAKLEKAPRAANRSAAQAQELGPQIQRAEQVIRQLALPWNDLFRTLEASQSKKIALLSVHPDATRKEVRIAAEARDFPAMVGYVERLQQSEWLSQAHLQTHQVREQEPERPIRFTVSASWEKKS
jgi:Tfp pilus assembly protein PilN